jgi:hypothetical protein
MNKKIILPAAILMAASFTACQNTGSDTVTTTPGHDSIAVTIPNNDAITVNPVKDSPAFPDGKLAVKSIKGEPAGPDSVKVNVEFDVQNYKLGDQTADAAGKGCNNSKQGQHIHFVLDNGPYAALYEPKHSVTLAKNSEHWLLTFLSRSYHEAVKTPSAYVLTHFSVDDKGTVTKMTVPKTPMLFYSRPKGNYIADDTKKVLLDWYLVNTTLSPEGNKVKASVNGKEFTLTDWTAYFIENAPMGDLKIKLELVDKDGKAIEGPYNVSERTVKLAEKEPF